MSTDNDSTMDAAMAAFGALDDPKPAPTDPNEEPRHDGEEQPLDLADESDDTSGEADEDQPGDEDEEEPEAPAIDPPARWTAEQRKLWSAIPAEAQREIAASAKDQERAIGLKAEEAATTRKQAEAILDQHISTHRQYAEQLNTYAQAIMPQRPDYSLLATDPQAYAYHMQVYEASTAQQQELQQRSAQAMQQAQQIEHAREAQANQAEYRAIVEAFPEWESEDGRKSISEKLTPVGRALGYDENLMAMAGATDLKALNVAAEWKSKADKYDAAMAKRMDSVREAKGKPRVATPGTAQPRGSARAQQLGDSMKRLKQTGDVRDAAAAFAKLG